MLLFSIEALLLGVLALLPAARALLGTGVAPRDRHAPALALHRAQLRELERDRAQGLIEGSEHQAARLEVERRLLAAADAQAASGGTVSSRSSPQFSPPSLPWGAAAVLALVLPAALGLYLLGGHPELPAQPERLRMVQAEARARQDDALIATLRRGLAGLDPATPSARQGYVLLGQVEASRGNLAAAAAAWRVALAHGFDPTLAVQAAEAQTRADNGVSAASAALFRRALDAAPADVPWRELAEQRLAQSEHR